MRAIRSFQPAKRHLPLLAHISLSASIKYSRWDYVTLCLQIDWINCRWNRLQQNSRQMLHELLSCSVEWMFSDLYFQCFLSFAALRHYQSPSGWLDELYVIYYIVSRNLVTIARSDCSQWMFRKICGRCWKIWNEINHISRIYWHRTEIKDVYTMKLCSTLRTHVPASSNFPILIYYCINLACH